MQGGKRGEIEAAETKRGETLLIMLGKSGLHAEGHGEPMADVIEA